jgi:hypothetical protein
MMYFYWKHHGIRPSVFYSLPKGELTVIRAFYEKEVDEKNELVRQAEGKASLVIPVDIS